MHQKTKLKEKKKILICPLNWGLGHASRDIPLINQLLKNNFEVIIAADKSPLQLLRLEFPNLKWERFPSYQVTYSKNRILAFKMFFSIPTIILGIYKEHKLLKTIIKKWEIDIVISDNRFGLWNKNIYTIFITHQIMIKPPRWLKYSEYPLYRLNRLIILKFNKCWIPDFDKRINLTGDLSHKYKIPANANFIGPLSRFSPPSFESEIITTYYEILVLLSGPEPQRTIFENLLIKQLTPTGLKTLIVRGISGKTDNLHTEKNIMIIPHLPMVKLQNAILSSKIIICRSGYSTIMDLITLRKKAILVPTPGQTEQEYLANYFKEKGIFYSIIQQKFDLSTALNNYKAFKKDFPLLSSDSIQQEIKLLKAL